MRTPWHLWLVGVLSLAWNAMGALDYLLTETRNASYMKAFTPEQLAYFYSFPAWAVSCWAVGVWGAVLGSVLLLFRVRQAIWAFAFSLLGVIGFSIWQFALAPVRFVDIAGSAALIMTVAIYVVGLALLWYARAMKLRGVLR
ncbi:hypothetical protein [Frigidibacter sp. ROC022]|uniref:hypothetical protein n=1 Tax=Frigidibacter sp. ROC022 TaxID=2971796 RepID=UPI00215AC7FB|nr:hypothetical protein [Frigidibacter sp. ROC022]MCR8722996.1 hypothetical protein [Frigidibacter sp. ROC022]